MDCDLWEVLVLDEDALSLGDFLGTFLLPKVGEIGLDNLVCTFQLIGPISLIQLVRGSLKCTCSVGTCAGVTAFGLDMGFNLSSFIRMRLDHR